MEHNLKLPNEIKNIIKLNKKNFHNQTTSLFTRQILKEFNINTVCENALCPNRGDCFKNKVATFMILGNICTRFCTFCAVSKGKLMPPDLNEPLNVAIAVQKLNLKYVVITSPTRDDLEDGGALHFKNVILKTKSINPNTIIEALVPDFKGNFLALKEVLVDELTVLSHNLETVKSLYSKIRLGANYERSLNLLNEAKKISNKIITKSGIMVGLGEKFEEVVELMHDLRNVNCDILTIGQYIAPSSKHYPVQEYVDIETFKKYKEIGLNLSFKAVMSAPLVRSSYLAEAAFNDILS